MKKNMPRSKNGPRSNFSFLPFALRFRVIGMIQDGYTAESIGKDEEVKKAYAAMGSSFNRASMTRIKKSAEYKELAVKRAKRKSAEESDALAAILLKENGSIENVAEQTKAALLQSLSDLLATAEGDEAGSDLSDMEKVKALRDITQSVLAITSQEKDNRIASLLCKLSQKDARIEASEKEWKNREAELLYTISELEKRIAELEKRAGKVDSSIVAAAMDEKFGVK